MRLKLAEELRNEFERLKDHPNFDTAKQTKEYGLAIKYLETGEYPSNYSNHELLEACIEDIEIMYIDYDIK